MLILPCASGPHEPLLTIVVPCFQEEEVLPEFHRRIVLVKRRLRIPCEILYIDDGSSDGSAALLKSYQDEDGVRCLFLSRNFGKEAALCAGIDHASGAALVFIDVDLQDPPELIETMVEYWQRGYDVVNMQRRSRLGDSWFKRTSACVYYWTMQRLVDRVVLPIDVSDFRLIGPAPLAALRALDERSRILKSLIGWVGFRTIELPYERTLRHAGSSKWSFLGLFDLAVESILGFSRKPLRWFSLISVGLWLSSLLYITTAFVVGRFNSHDWLVGIAAFICLGVAMVGEYLGATLSEVKRRPHYVLKEKSRPCREKPRTASPSIKGRK